MYYSSNEPQMYNAGGAGVNGWTTAPSPRCAGVGQTTTTAPPVEQPTYYGRPSYHQQPLADSSDGSSQRLAFLYDRDYTAPATHAQPTPTQQQISCQPRPLETTTVNNYSGRYGNVVDDVPPPLPASLPPPPPSCAAEYQPMSRAMPAPMFQHAPPPTGRQTVVPQLQQHQNGWSQPTELTSPSGGATDLQNHMSRLNVNNNNDRHNNLPPTPSGGGATGLRASRDVTAAAVPPTTMTSRTRTLPISYARRQSAPGPCLPPSSSGGGRRQWPITPCGFTNNRGRQAVVNGGRSPSISSEILSNGLYTPQPAPRTAEGPKLIVSDSSRRNLMFGSQESFLGVDKSMIDNSSIRYNLREGDEIGDYEQTSIRYTGKANPSRIFSLLQQATGSDTETDVKLAQAAMHQQVRRRRPTQEEVGDQPNADDIVDISYVGSNIPSRTFQCLQEALGARDQRGVDEMSNNVEEPSRSVRVVHLRPSMKKHSSMDNILSYSDL